MPEQSLAPHSSERRRSERVIESLPIIVRGVDLLGQPFEERTSTLVFNLHGCRYVSRFHLPKNTWVTLELPQRPDRRNVRARVTWIQRPHSVRESFQIGVEMERPENIWAVGSPPTDWAEAATKSSAPETSGSAESLLPSAVGPQAIPATLIHFMEKLMTDMKSDARLASPGSPEAAEALSESPLLRELRAELAGQASRAVEAAAAQAQQEIRRAAEEADQKRSATAAEFFRRWQEEFERAQSGAREELSAHVAATREEARASLASELEEAFSRARELMAELGQQAATVRAEVEGAQEVLHSLARARLEIEAAEAAGEARESWRQRLDSEIEAARAQWSELLASSIDSSIARLVERVAEESQEVLRSAEEKMNERLADLRRPFVQMASEARETVTDLRGMLEPEVSRAQASLAEIEQAVSRMREFSTQLEAASEDTLNQLQRRLENAAAAQTAEINHRAESLAAGLSERVAPALDSLGQRFVEQTIAKVEARLTSRLDRVSELLSELAAQEGQVEESLRLHRERLRQVSEKNQREAGAQMASTLAELRANFEAARKEALEKWDEELDACGVRASHAAAEAIERTSEWFQQEARTRLQLLVEQSLATTGSGFEAKAAEGERKFEALLLEQSTAHLAQIQGQLEGLAGEFLGRARAQMGAAAEATAASFGQLLRGISDHEAEQFTDVSRRSLAERQEELERSARELLGGVEASAKVSLDSFDAQMAAQLEAKVAEGRAALGAEFASALEGYRAERDARQMQWLESFDHLSNEAIERHQERLRTACDSWMAASVRRLNEQGQNIIESLMRAADQSVRDSCSKIFDGLASLLRERETPVANATGIAGFTPPPECDAPDTPIPRNADLPTRPNL